MLVEIREGGDGVACWNDDAISAYADFVNRREQSVATANPDVRVTPGRIKCYGCEVMEYDMGTRCTAMLEKSLFAVVDEVGPRAEDAKSSLSDIPGLITRIDPAPGSVAEPEPTPLTAPVPEDRPRGLRGLLGRR